MWLCCREQTWSAHGISRQGGKRYAWRISPRVEREQVDTKGLLSDENYFTTLAFVDINEAGERTFVFRTKTGSGYADPEGRTGYRHIRPHKYFPYRLAVPYQSAGQGYNIYAVKRAKNKGSIISYDPNYRASLWEDEKTASGI